jgi:hypothetical protein
MNVQKISEFINGYPPWLVVAAGAVFLVLFVWLGFKILKKVFVAAIVTAVLAAIGVGIWFALK